MIRREELETALAQAEAAQARLEAALAEAKTALVNTVTDAARIDANRAEASAKVDKARARCRELRAALADPSHQEFITRSRERVEALIKQPDQAARPNAAPGPPSRQSSAQPVRGGNRRSRDESPRRMLLSRFNSALAAAPHVREAIGLLGLILAYLQYYHFDVQLEILRLPSVIALQLQQ